MTVERTFIYSFPQSSRANIIFAVAFFLLQFSSLKKFQCVVFKTKIREKSTHQMTTILQHECHEMLHIHSLADIREKNTQ